MDEKSAKRAQVMDDLVDFLLDANRRWQEVKRKRATEANEAQVTPAQVGGRDKSE